MTSSAYLVQVDHQRAAAGRQVKEPPPQPGHGGNVNLPDCGHDRIVVFVLHPDGQCLTRDQPPVRRSYRLAPAGATGPTLARSRLQPGTLPAMLPTPLGAESWV